MPTTHWASLDTTSGRVRVRVRVKFRVRVRFQIDQRAMVIRPLAPPNIPKIVGLSKE